jgi:hypothetical protein
MARIALSHHAARLEGGIGDFSNRELLVVGLLSGDDGSIGAQHEVNTRIRHQVGLELSDIYVQGTIESEGGSER